MLKHFWMASGLFPLLSLCAGEQTIAFAPETVLSVNGVREIQPVTGMVCNGESRMKFVEESKALNIPATRLYLWVASPGGKLPLEKRVEALLAKRSPEAIAEEFDRNLHVGKFRDGKTPTAQYWQLEQLGAWNAVGNVTLHLANFHPRSRADFQPYAEYYINCIREIRKRYPNLEINRLMIFNEPNYEFPRNWDKSLSEGVRLFLEGYNYVKKEVERNVSDLNVIGPGLASSATLSWTGWKDWTVPFLHTAGTATEFNQQIYTNRFNDLLAWDSMLQAASLAIRGKGIPTVTTECNVDLTIRDKKWQEHRFHVDRVRDEASLLFGMMRHPEIFRLKTYFLYLYTCDIRDLHYRQPDGSVKPAPVYYVFRLLNDLRGSRIYAVNDREDSPVECIASNDRGKVVIALFNRSDVPQTVKLKRLNGIDFAGIALEERLWDEKETERFRFEERRFAPRPTEFTLQPRELRKYTTFSGDKIRSERRETEVYSKVYAQTIAGKPLSVPLPVPPGDGAGYYRLRFAVYVDDVLNTDVVRWSFNGERFSSEFLFEKENRQAQPILSVEKIIPQDRIARENVLKIEPVPGASLKLMSASLKFSPLLPGTPSIRRSASGGIGESGYSVTLLPPSEFQPGLNRIRYSVSSNVRAGKSPRLEIKLPARWREISRSDREITVEIPSGEYRGPKMLSALLKDSSGKTLASTRRGAVYRHTLSAAPGTGINGNRGAFSSQIVLPNGEKFATSLSASWNPDRLTFRVELSGRPVKIARDRNFFWNADSLELFFDFLNRKANVRDDSTAQLVVIPVSSDGKCEVMSFPYHKDGYPLSSRRLTDVSASFRIENGRTVFDLSVPWKVLTEGMNASVAFKPAAGAVLGFDAALNGQDIFGAREKQYAIPSAWGNLKLEPEGAVLPGEFRFSPVTERKRSVYLPGKTSAGWSVTGAGRDLPAGRLLSVDQSVLKTSAPLPGSEMELAVELAGFQAEKKEKPFACEVRIFLTPDSLKGYVEPYIMKNVLWLWCFYSEKEGLNLSLMNGRQALWNGTVAGLKFPLTLRLSVNSRGYRIASSSELQTGSGTPSGFLELPEAWKAPWNAGVKCLKGNQPGGVIVKSVRINE